jgi:hypothetical protein
VLLLAAAVWGGWSASLNAASGATIPSLPGLGMGLMMGSLWLSSQWCLGSGWTDPQAVALHLVLMVGVPLLPAAWRRSGLRAPGAGDWQAGALLAAGALLMACADATEGRVAGMVLLVLAWSLNTHRPPTAGTNTIPVPAGLGPALLLAAGLLAPSQGPTAMQAAWGFVAALALLGLVPWRSRLTSPPLETRRWSAWVNADEPPSRQETQSNFQSAETACPTRNTSPSPASTIAFMPKVIAPFSRGSCR